MLLQNVVDRLLARRPDAQLIFAGPNISNPGVFGEILEISLLRQVRTRSPAVLQNLITVNTRSPLRTLSLARMSGEGRQPLGETPVGRALPSVRERLVRVAERFGRGKPSIVYANGPADAEKVALGLAEVSHEIAEDGRIAELVSLVKLAVHDHYDLARCLPRRVGLHYGRIPALVRRAIEAAFAEGTVRFLVTTSTLIQGVNFPAANLFVCKPRKGGSDPLDASEFWNLAGRAGRLGREFQGNVFLIDYDDWDTRPADQGNEVEVQSALKRTLGRDLTALIDCALEADPARESGTVADIEAAFARLLSDFTLDRIGTTLDRCGVPAPDRERLIAALGVARRRVNLPAAVLAASPTVSPLRQQRLANYLTSELSGGGTKRLAELLPRHPRDEDAFRYLCEVFRICHEQILSFTPPKLHVRMAAIALKWMRGEPLPAIIDENHRRSGGADIGASIRNTLRDIEEDVRFKYFRLTICYISVLAYVLGTTGHSEYLRSLPALPSFLEVGASDPTMVSFVSLGLSRVVARILTDRTMEKDMDEGRALAWLRSQDLSILLGSSLMRAEVERVLANAPTG